MNKFILACMLAFSTTALAQEKSDLPGLEIGKKAPDFELQDQLGKPIRLSEMLKRGPAAVVFHRSASW